MVLRGVDRGRGRLTFYTDGRAGKVAAIAACPGAAVVAWDAADRLQVRLHGAAAVVAAGAAVDAAWTTIPPAARCAYRTLAPPGTSTASAAVAATLGDSDGRATFALVTIDVETIEWLELASPGHRRARYRRAGDGWQGDWLVP